ncbi:MAG: hypothetical protein WC614_12395 [bacterium]
MNRRNFSVRIIYFGFIIYLFCLNAVVPRSIDWHEPVVAKVWETTNRRKIHTKHVITSSVFVQQIIKKQKNRGIICQNKI